MLEGLDQVDWGGLHHFKGRADDIPRIIRDLTSNQERVVAGAHHELETCLVKAIFKKKILFGPSCPVVQGYLLSDAAEYIIPFLIELLESEQLRVQDGVFRLIDLMVDIVGDDNIDKSYGLYLAYSTDIPKKDAQEFKRWSNIIYNKLRSNMCIYAAYLGHKDINDFYCALGSLKRFKNANDDFGKIILTHFNATSDHVRKVNMIWLMGRFNLINCSSIFHDIYNRSNDPLIKFSAAVNIGLIKESLTEDQVDCLIRSIEKNIEKLHASYLDSSLSYASNWDEIWPVVGNYWKVMEEIFLASSDSIKSRAVSAMLKSLPDRLFWVNDDQHNTLLSVVFSDWKDPEGYGLDEKQKQAVLAVAQDAFYQEADLPNPSIFTKFSLPGNYRGIANYLGILKSDLDSKLKTPRRPEKWWKIGWKNPNTERSISIDGLDEIDWKSLRSIHGNADRVPQAIRNLASSNQRLREDELDRLHYELVESFYYKDLAESGYYISQAAAYAFPFLIKLLELPKVQSKGDILYLIRLMHQATQVTDLDILKTQYANHIAKVPNEDAVNIKEWLQGFHHQIRKKLLLFASLIDDVNYDTFNHASMLLFEFPDCHEEIGQKVLASFRAAADTKRQAKLLWLLGQINRRGYYDLFEEVYNSSYDPLIGFTAALNAGMANESPTKKQLEHLALSFCLDVFSPSKDCGYAELPWDDEKLTAILSKIIPTLSYTVKRNLFSMLFNQFKGSRMTSGQHKILLYLAFSDWEDPEIYNAAKIQKRAVMAVAQDIFRPRSRSENTDLSMVLEEFGLPATIGGIAKYLGVYPIDIINYK